MRRLSVFLAGLILWSAALPAWAVVNVYPYPECIALPATSSGIVGSMAGGESATVVFTPTAQLGGTDASSTAYFSHGQEAIARKEVMAITTANSQTVTLASGDCRGLGAGMTCYAANIPNNAGSLYSISTFGSATTFNMSSGTSVLSSSGLPKAMEVFSFSQFGSGNKAGIDLGSNVTALPSRWRIVPTPSWTVYQAQCAGLQLIAEDQQSSTDATFAASHTITLDQVPFNGRNLPQPYQWNDRPLNASEPGSYPYRTASGENYAIAGGYRLLGVTSAGTGAYSPGNNTALSRVQIIIDTTTIKDGSTSGSSTTKMNCMPCEPAFQPNGGRYSASSVSVSITSPTASAAIIYTTDGVTVPAATYSGGKWTINSSNTSVYSYGPTGSGNTISDFNSGPAVTGPNISITPSSGGLKIKAMALDANATTPNSFVWTSAPYWNTSYRTIGTGSDPNNWYDTEGNKVFNQSGGIWQEGTRIDWYGDWGNVQSQNITGALNPIFYQGLWHYSSGDGGQNWVNHGCILDNGGYYSVFRPTVVKHPTTGNYLLYGDAIKSDGTKLGIMVASAPTANGPWKWVTKPVNFNSGSPISSPGSGNIQYLNDHYAFVDNGVIYLACEVDADNSTHSILIYRMTADGLASSGTYTAVVSGNYEAPVLFKNGGTFFLITATSTYYNSGGSLDGTDQNASFPALGAGDVLKPFYYYTTASTPMSGWTAGPTTGGTVGALYPSSTANTIYNAQPAGVFQWNGQWVLISDYWVTYSLLKSRPVAVPLRMPTPTTIEVGIGGAGIPFASGWGMGTAIGSYPSTWNMPSTAAPVINRPVPVGQKSPPLRVKDSPAIGSYTPKWNRPSGASRHAGSQKTTAVSK